MYSVEEIKELLKAFDESKATKLEIKSENGEQFTVSQQQTKPVVAVQEMPVRTVETVIEEETVSAESSVQPAVAAKSDGTPITSPMVGVFYAAPAPDKDPYVSVGSKVSKGDVLCLIEAMKLMNEVTAEKNGEITEICVENGQVVEYGQPLFLIK